MRSAPLPEELTRRLRTGWEFLRYVAYRFVYDNGLRHASTLAYTTLLSIVPLMTVAFSVLAAFPVFEPVTDRIRLLIFANFVPTSSEVLESYLERFSDKAAELTAAGIIGLLASALLMMSSVDKALNEIWHVSQQRRLVQGFMVYWTLLTLGPLLIGASLVMTSYVESLQAFAAIERTLPRQLLFNLASLASEFLAFLFLYTVVPNRQVSFRHAVCGAALAALLFEAAKLTFAWYVTSFPTYEAIYGALAALPVFLIWLYVSWTIVLVGAVFTHALGSFRVERAGTLADPRLRLALAVRLLGHLWYAHQSGESVSRKDLVQREPQAGDQAIVECLRALERSKVVVRTDHGGWALVRDLSGYTLLDLYRSEAFILPEPALGFGERDVWDHRFAEVLRQAAAGVHRALDLPLEALFRDRRPEEGDSQPGQ